MRKIFILVAVIIFAVAVSCNTNKESKNQASEIRKVWSVEQAQKWKDQVGWLRGSNFNPSTAINQLETWQAESFDTVTINRELKWASDIGMNCMRVYLHHVAWEVDKEGFKGRMNKYLQIADRHGIKTIFVFYSGWVRDPGDLLYRDSTLMTILETYVKDVLTTFREDSRIAMWDMYNEPGNSGYGNKSIPLLEKAFEWGWEVRPLQPLSSGVWSLRLSDLNKIQIENSDIITYHNYDSPEKHLKAIDTLRLYGRPLVCTEYMARRNNSLFTNIMPILKENNIGAINWGLVSGKSNTKYAWDEPVPDGSEPPLWFHEIFRPDGTPYKQEEVDLIKSLTLNK